MALSLGRAAWHEPSFSTIFNEQKSLHINFGQYQLLILLLVFMDDFLLCSDAQLTNIYLKSIERKVQKKEMVWVVTSANRDSEIVVSDGKHQTQITVLRKRTKKWSNVDVFNAIFVFMDFPHLFLACIPSNVMLVTHIERDRQHKQ